MEPRRLSVALLAALCLAVAGCGEQLQDSGIPDGSETGAAAAATPATPAAPVEDAAKAKSFDEAIFLASVSPPSGPSEAMMTDPTGASPTKLWLKGGLPGGKAVREPVPGTLRQETFIRVYIPIRPTAKK